MLIRFPDIQQFDEPLERFRFFALLFKCSYKLVVYDGIRRVELHQTPPFCGGIVITPRDIQSVTMVASINIRNRLQAERCRYLRESSIMFSMKAQNPRICSMRRGRAWIKFYGMFAIGFSFDKIVVVE